MLGMFAGLTILTIGLIGGIKLLLYGKREREAEDNAIIGGWVIIGVVLVTSTILFWTGLSSLFVEKWWFESLGYVAVFWKMLTTRWELFFGFGAIATIFLWLNSFIANKLAPKTRITGEWAVNNQAALWLTVIFITIASLSLGGWAMTKWDEILKYQNQVSFGDTDPIFKKDVGFYIFSLPVYDFVSWWLWVILLCGLSLVVSLYYYAGYREEEYEQQIAKKAVSHGAILWLGLLIVSGWRSIVQIWQLVYSPRGAVFGAGYTDIHAQLGAYKFLVEVRTALLS